MDNWEIFKVIAYASIIPLVFLIDYLMTNYNKVRDIVITLTWIATPILLGVFIFSIFKEVIALIVRTY